MQQQQMPLVRRQRGGRRARRIDNINNVLRRQTIGVLGYGRARDQRTEHHARGNVLENKHQSSPIDCL